MKKTWTMLLIMVVAVTLILSGCSGQQAAAPAPNTGGDQNGFAEKPEFEWKMQVIHSVGHSDFKQNQEAAELVYQASNGRLKIEVVPNGTFVSSLEGFQAAGDGVFEMHSSWPIYAKGVEYAFLPLGGGSMQMEAIDKWVWLYEAGGWELFQKAFDKMNLELLATEIWGTEVMMAKKPFNSISEMEGAKMRTSDPRLLATYGASGLPMPLEEVFTAMATGAVDSAEFGSLKYNEGLGLLDISDYAIWPDFWNVNMVTTVVVNQDAWKELPDDLKLIVEMAFKSMEQQHWTRSQYESALTMKEYEENGELEFIRMEGTDFGAARARMYEIEQKDAEEHGGLTKEVYDSINNFQETWYPYKHMARWWGADLTPEEQIGKE